MEFKKAQVEIRELVLTLVMAGLLFTVGLLIFSNVFNTTDSILDPTKNTQLNESITISAITSNDDNSTLLTQSGFIENTESVLNRTTATALVRNQDYVITLTGASGGLTTRANFTLLNISGTSSFNNTALSVTYNFNTESSAQASTSIIQTTVLDSFSLGVIALIVLAAVVILGVLFKLGS